ncbi:hypothetical protein C6495_03375 [Candidatus Poribacteria bacterium]|nr:MAG: hypothetical protein C6495_03375 [Candidatus Poribacteria bacterium]
MQTRFFIPGTPENMTEYVILINKPSSTELAGQNRAETYAEMQANTARHREAIAEWLEEQGDLSSEVAGILEPTAFPVLFIICTSRVAKELEHAPGVENVALSPQMKLIADRKDMLNRTMEI